ncbi:hypothetical protein LX83_007173, partial [Goodfellowiella coeruleoviolacea]|nr:hypothetical protein [Goodfellowiella coeruleoviolacea]
AAAAAAFLAGPLMAGVGFAGLSLVAAAALLPLCLSLLLGRRARRRPSSVDAH